MAKTGTTPISPTLAINERVNAMREEGVEVVNLGFGQAPFPVPERLQTALSKNVRESDYLPVSGLPELLGAVAEHQALHARIDMDAFDVLIGPGSKNILFAIQLAIPGDTLLPVPSWVSYSPQVSLLGQRCIPAPMALEEQGLSISASDIDRVVRQARSASLNPTKLLINFPNNPTGLTFSNAVLEVIANACRENNLTLISDEIYGRLSYDHCYRSAAHYYSEKTVVTTGLSKHLSIGGWRLGVSLIPKGIPGLYERLCHIASETWSCVAAPIQYAAIDAYRSHSEIEAYIRNSTDIHAFVTTYVAQKLSELNLDCCTPQGGFYTWPDFSTALSGIYASSEELAQSLLNKHGVATLPGVAFGENPAALRLRLACCDYSGEEALKIWSECCGEHSENGLIEKIAPKIVFAMQEIQSFVKNESCFTSAN